MHRRQLAKSVAVAAAAAMIPIAARAEADPMENIVFTASDPGHWADVKKLHVPIITVSGGVMNVRTPHPMSKPHFIVSHTVILAGGKFLDRKTFTYLDQPVSKHTLPAGYRGIVTVTSTCNLHDFWMETISV